MIAASFLRAGRSLSLRAPAISGKSYFSCAVGGALRWSWVGVEARSYKQIFACTRIINSSFPVGSGQKRGIRTGAKHTFADKEERASAIASLEGWREVGFTAAVGFYSEL